MTERAGQSDGDIRAQAGEVEALLEQLEHLPEGPPRDVGLATVRALVGLYGEGLARVVEHAARSTDAALPQVFAADEVLAHLLLLHGLHPEDLETRVRHAVDSVRPYLEQHGGTADVVAVDGGEVHLRLGGSCRGSAASAALRRAVEEAVWHSAPDASALHVDDGDEPDAVLVPLVVGGRASGSALAGRVP